MRHEICACHADFLELWLLLDLLLDGHSFLQSVGEQNPGPQAFEGMAQTIPDHSDFGVETLGKSARDALVVEVIQDVDISEYIIAIRLTAF
jgi:hypothetical protein